MSIGTPEGWGVTLHSASNLNGITQRWADTAVTDEDRKKPCILMIHGWPESWWSYRHQLKAVHAAGYRGIAPDMRGYGGTDAPEHFSEYTNAKLAADMKALLTHLGYSKCCLVGHDHGANTGWDFALLHPEMFVCYLALSVPRGVHTRKGPPHESMRKVFGDETKPETKPKYFYQLHHCLPNAQDDYAEGTVETFKMLYGDMTDAEPPLFASDLLYDEDGHAQAMWKRGPRPAKLASWISQEEFDYFTNEFSTNGWNGGLNWYRVIDTNYAEMPQLEGLKCKVPASFIAGTADAVTVMAGGVENIKTQLIGLCGEGGCKIQFVEGAGHWIQQERPDVVNSELLEFAGENSSRFAPGSKSML